MKYFSLFLFFLAVGCWSQKTLRGGKIREVNLEDGIPDDIRIPSKVWNRIEQYSKPENEIPVAQNNEEDERFVNKNSILFIPITVVLHESNPEVLETEEIRIALPRGGGKIDLSEYLGSKVGSFFVRFEFPKESPLRNIQSFFISQARKRKIDGEIHGAGCNKFMDITSYVAKENAGAGIKVNTTRDRHSTVLGGHFIFAGKKDIHTFLAQVSFIDSKNPHLFCDAVKAATL